jgi:hypothetical protein
LSDEGDDEDFYRLQPEEEREPSKLPTESISHWLDKAEAEIAAEEPAQAPSTQQLKQDAGKWFKTAMNVVSGLSQKTKSLADSSARTAEAAKIKNIALPQAYAALGRALYQDRRYLDELPQIYGKLDDLVQKIDQLHATGDDPAQPSILERAKRSVRRTADATTSKALSLQMGQHLQQLGNECFQRLGPECAPQELAETIRTLLRRLDELNNKA